MSESDKVGEVLPDWMKKAYARTPESIEQKRHEDECLCVARLMWRGNESEYLKLVEKARGKDVADKLKWEAMDLVKEHRK